VREQEADPEPRQKAAGFGMTTARLARREIGEEKKAAPESRLYYSRSLSLS
jgi:hypothetical protein